MSTLNDEQLQAVNSNSDRILCLAGAGAGKTKTMLDRISRLIDDGAIPSSILALTFTVNAATEMRERYESSHVGQITPEFRTFHSFCYSMLCKDIAIRNALNYSDIPNIASEAQEKAIHEQAMTQCNVHLSKDQLKNRVGLTKKEQFTAELYDKAVNRLMRQSNLITFDKLNIEMADLFAANHVSTQPYKLKYKYILCDEFQDTDSYQIKFLSSFENTDFFFCGDTLQNIYGFRGTSNEFIKALSNTPDWDKIKLFKNYRSTNQICKFANAFAAGYADDSYRIEMQGQRDGEDVKIKVISGNPDPVDLSNIDEILDTIKTLDGTSAILCRTNKEIAAISSYLKENDVEFTSSKDTKLIHLIKCAISDEYMIGWLASYLSSDKYGEYIRLSSQYNAPNIQWFLSTYGSNPRISADSKKIDILKDISTQLNSVQDKIQLTKDAFKLGSISVPDKDLFGVEFLKYLEDATIELKSSELYVGTIHSVKGLEYDNVFVLNVGSFSFRLGSEEMNNLYYVAITRAKNRLFVYKVAKPQRDFKVERETWDW